MKCKKCGTELNEHTKNCTNCGMKNPNYTHFYIKDTAIKVSKPTFVSAIIIGFFAFFIIMFALVPANSGNANLQKETSIQNTESKNAHEPLITYEEAFDYVKSAEDAIIKNNKYSFNNYKESAAEVIIYSDEYATLYCSYWSALEELEGENDSRFEKSKLRWELDFSKEEWTAPLKSALENEGKQALYDEFYRIYNEEVFPAVKYRWENNIH